MYYSDKFLNDELNDALNDNFGDIFEAYEEIKEYGEKLGISLIKDKTFNEDTIMCYHYVTFYKDNYSPNAEYVLASLKEKLSAFGKNRDSDGITKLIKAYAEHLTTFFRYLRSLVKRAEEDERLYKLFSVLGLSANLYPLLVAADIKNLLYRPLSTDGNYLLLDILEGLDIKVYKTLGSWAAKWMAGIAYETMNGELNLEKELMNYSRHYCDESYFKKCLRKYAYHNRALVHILIAYCEHLSDETYGTERLRELMSNKGGPSKEHILSQTPDFDPIAFGFTDGEDYNEHLNGIGNITLLEWSLNSGAGNRSFLKKSEIYSKSAFKITSRLGAWLAENKNFKKADMQEREEELINFCVTRWRF
jgi:hypothetical protein